MDKYAIVDNVNNIVSFSSEQTEYNPEKGSAENPASWRSLPCVAGTPPPFDPETEVITGPTYVVNPTDVTEMFGKRLLTEAELQAIKDTAIEAADDVLWAIAYDHENRILALEGKVLLTEEEFKTAVEELL